MSAKLLSIDDLVSRVILITGAHGPGANEFTKTLASHSSLVRRLLATGALLGMEHVMVQMIDGQLEDEEDLAGMLVKQVAEFGKDIPSS